MEYSIDADDRIQALGDGWDEFATANRGERARRSRILGSSIWEHIHGTDARKFHRALLAAVRGRGRVALPFRCDAPDRRRYMELHAQAEEESGAVHFRAVLVHEEERQSVELLGSNSRSGAPVDICSQCRRLSVKDRWWEVEDAIRHLDLYESERFPPLREVVCPECMSQVEPWAD